MRDRGSSRGKKNCDRKIVVSANNKYLLTRLFCKDNLTETGRAAATPLGEI